MSKLRMPSPRVRAPITPGSPIRLGACAVGVLLALGLWLASAVPASAACANPVACENALPGDPPSDWQVQKSGDPTIQGFATSMSVDVGQTESFKIDTPSTAYHIDILRLGYYGGDGARKVASDILPSATLPQTQPACNQDASTGLIDCGNWGVSASWTVPSDAVSGVYVAHLVRDDSEDRGGDSLIPFVVRNDASHSDVLVSTSDATWEAYNDYGGNSLYTCTVSCPPGSPMAYKGAYAVSYNRPWDGAAVDGGASSLFYAEYQMIRWLEKNGYDVSYTSSSDVDRAGSLLLNHKIFMSSGHDEYWSAAQRANVTAARDAGVNLAFFSGNELFWKTRWGPSTADGSSTPYRTLISYKETHFNSPVDPQDPSTWTGSWRDPRFSPPADGGNPENALTGQYFAVNAGTADLVVPYQYSKLRLWRDTSVAKLSPGQSQTLSPGTGTLGYEWDIDADNGFRPPGLIDMSSTTVSGTQDFTDYGSQTAIGTETHHLTLYRAPSGALVFGAGTVQWSWGLDNTNAWQQAATDPSGNPPDPDMEQATVNLFADMGVQPTTLSSDLAPAAKSTDTTPPTSTISSPSAGSAVQDGSSVTITGSATDAGGGVVAGIEVSTDDGKTWHPANLTTADSQTVTWSYTWAAHGNPSAVIETRATDDSGNIETPSDLTSVKVSCPCTIWGDAVTPSTPDSGDTKGVEVGVKFKSDAYGVVNGVRFYKASTNTGTHVGDLWTASGQKLASAVFSDETASGWQTVTFATPVAIMPNTTYVVSYYAPAGHYAATSGYFYAQPSPPPNGGGFIDSPPLHAIPNATSPNGVYSYGPAGTFPVNSFQASNYWVDPMFTPTPPPGQVTNVTATPGYNSATVSWTAPASGGATAYTVTPYIGSTAQSPTTVSGSPPATSVTINGLTAGTTYTFTVQASNPNGAGPASLASAPATPTGPTAPYAPTGVSATPATGQARVSWTAPDANGSAITGYTITPYVGATAQTPVQVIDGGATSATVSGLTNGTSYTFTVSATNGLGTSPESSASTAVTPQNTLFDLATPTTVDSGDGTSVDVGVKFTSDTSGSITGVRFYKAAANGGTHVGSLWSASGTLLASATFTNETASGWQYVLFSSPVPITAGQTYVASYLAPDGHYSLNSGGLAAAVDNPPLHTVPNTTSKNGVFVYSQTSAFPTNTFGANNYWVAPMFAPTPPGQVTGVSATAGHASATVSWSPPASGGATTYTITPYIGSTAQTPTTVTGSPPATSATINALTPNTAYTFTVQASNAQGQGDVSAPSNAVTPSAPTAPDAPANVSAVAATNEAQVNWTASAANGSPLSAYTVTPYIGSTAQTPIQVDGSSTSATVTGLTNGAAYTFTVSATNSIGTSAESTASPAVTPQDTIFDLGTPATADSGDSAAAEVGVKFTADTSGSITGIRFYKAAANTGTHVGSLWTSSGTLLASATFSSETGTGWQYAAFSSPVPISAGTTYIAGYLAPNGHYSTTPLGLGSAINNPPLHTVPNSTSPNGVYVYSSTPTLPTQTYRAGNYWVDVEFEPSVPSAPSNVTATPGINSATVNWTAPASGGATSYIITPYIGSAAQTSTTVKGSPPATSVTITGLSGNTDYTFTVQAANAQGTGPASAASAPVTINAPTAPAAPGSVTATPATGQAQVSWTTPNANGSPITAYTITPFIGSTAQTPVQVNSGSATSATVSSLTNGATYTFTVSATNGAGTSPASSGSNAVVPSNAIFDFGSPAVVDSGDKASTEVGVKFTADTNGSVTGLRFYKAATNTGSHVGGLWDASGTLLATVTFTNETASGWQYALFSSPVPITAGQTYVASYLAPNGHYSQTTKGLVTAVNNPPLHTVPNATSANGVFAYTTSLTFPTSTFNATNYWVDVLFTSP